jgi:hypothetical protein
MPALSAADSREARRDRRGADATRCGRRHAAAAALRALELAGAQPADLNAPTAE